MGQGKLLRLGSGLLVAAESLNALHHQNDGQNHQQHSDDAADVEPHHALTAGDDTGDLCLDGEGQRGQGHHQHEEHGEVEHLVAAADLAQPAAHSQQTQSSQQLVGSA